MASSAQIEANRRNSQKSTGPRTPAGKASSSQNARKSGIYAESLLIVGEESDDLDALAADYTATCAPRGPLETALVNELIHADWLLRRIRTLETQIWDDAINFRARWDGADYDDSQRLRTAYDKIDAKLVVVQRRISALERSYHRAMTALQRLQNSRPADPPDRLPDNPLSDPSGAPSIGFVPQQRPNSPTPEVEKSDTPTPSPLETAAFSPTVGAFPPPRSVEKPDNPRLPPPGTPAKSQSGDKQALWS